MSLSVSNQWSDPYLTVEAWWNIYQVNCDKLSAHVDLKPVVAFVNTRSGGQQGMKVLSVTCQQTPQAQVQSIWSHWCCQCWNITMSRDRTQQAEIIARDKNMYATQATQGNKGCSSVKLWRHHSQQGSNCYPGETQAGSVG